MNELLSRAQSSLQVRSLAIRRRWGALRRQILLRQVERALILPWAALRLLAVLCLLLAATRQRRSRSR